MKSKLIITAIVLVLLGATAVKLLSNKQTVEARIYRPEANHRILVQADTVSMRPLKKTLTYTGTFEPNREAMIIPQVQGEVRGIYFEEGDHVPAGKLLVQIDDDLLQARKIAATANFQTASRNYDRYQNAAQSGGVSGLQVDQYNLSMKNADSELRQINKQIALSRIVAPFSGTITLRDVEIGSVVGSMPIARITDMAQLKLVIAVPEKEIQAFEVGKTIPLETQLHPGVTLQGKVDYVAIRSDEAHNYTVRILIRNTPALDLKAGMYGTARIGQDLSAMTLSIPRTALIGSAKSPQVYVIENGTANLRDILTGAANDERVEVLEGLAAGDLVITSGHINLTQGSQVQIAD